MDKKKYIVVLYFIVVGCLRYIFLLLVTPNTPGVNPDSTVYIGGANSLYTGHGYSLFGNPITHYPPLYSFILAFGSFFANNLLFTTRVLNATFFGLNIALAGVIVHFSTGQRLLITSFALLLFVVFVPVQFIHSWAWSEPVLLSCTFGSITFLTRYLTKPVISDLIISAIFLGLASISRYIGAAFLPAALVIIFWSGKDYQINQKIKHSLIYALITCLPLFFFIVRNMVVSDSATNRSFAIHPVSQFVIKTINAIFQFFIPTTLPTIIRLIFLGVLITLLIPPILIYRKQSPIVFNWHSENFAIPIICLVFCFSYFFFLFISISFFDAATPIDLRIVSPCLLIFAVGFFSLMCNVSQNLKIPVVQWGLNFALIILISIHIYNTVCYSNYLKQQGLGNTSYTSDPWIHSQSIASVKLLQADMLLYSNGADAVNFLTSKPAQQLPQKKSSTSLEENLDYSSELMEMCNKITEGKAYLVYLYQVNWRWWLPDQEELESTCRLPILKEFSDGVIFGVK